MAELISFLFSTYNSEASTLLHAHSSLTTDSMTGSFFLGARRFTSWTAQSASMRAKHWAEPRICFACARSWRFVAKVAAGFLRCAGGLWEARLRATLLRIATSICRRHSRFWRSSARSARRPPR